MKTAAIAISLLSSLALLVQATPIEDVTSKGGYYIKWCKGSDYKGGCESYQSQKSGSCYEMESDYNNACSSVEHSSGYKCYYYNKSNCKGQYLSSSENYKKLPSKYDDNVSSYMCEQDD